MRHGIRRLFAVVSLSVVVSAAVAVGAGAAVAAPVQPTVDGLVSRWSFDDDPAGTTAADVGGGGNALTLHGDATFGGTGPDLGVSNPGTLAINGTGYATAAANLLTGAQDFTMTVWVNFPTPLQATGANLMGIDGKALINYNISVTQQIGYGAFSPTFGRTIYGHPVTAGWHLLAFTYDASGLQAYEDGSLVNSLPGHSALNLGTGITLGDPSRPLTASFDDARIYDRGLSANEIRGLAFSCANVSEIPRSECQALVDLYLSTDSTHWTNSTGWLATNTPCSWFGVGCLDGHVILLGLPSNHLAGPLTASLGDLPSLIALVLSGNQLTGTIPPTLTGLTALQTLSLRENALSGGIPAGIGNMTALAALNLAENQLTGDVPTGITGLGHLTGLDVTDNGIYPTDPAVRTFLSSFNPTWLNSQTIPPTTVQTTAVSATGATLAWTPIAYTGDGGYYEVLAVDPGTGVATPAGRTADKTAAGLSVTGLTPGPDYSFVVRTVTPPHGVQLNTVTSEPSAPATPAATVPGAPTITSVTPGDGVVTVAFTPPASDGGSAVTGYTVTSSPGGRTATGAAGPLDVSGLTNGTSYTFTVLATNAVGDGPASAASDAVTPRAPVVTTVPGAPTITSATPADGAVTVAFTAPSSDGGTPITGYTVTASPGGLTATGTTGPLTVSGLTNGVSYTFTVVATNAVGPGPASAPSNAVTPQAPVVTTTTEQSSPAVSWDSWRSVTDPAANGGGYAVSSTRGATERFHFSGSSVTWLARKGPDRGMAAITIDGNSKGTVDLYAATAGNGAYTYGRLGRGGHDLTIRVLGTKRAAATAAGVAVDGFLVGSSTAVVPETAVAVRIDDWVGTTSTRASGGSYRSTGTTGATAAFTFTGTGVDWITAFGPTFGKVTVRVDGGPGVTVDLYRAAATWQAVGRSVTGLSQGSHTITVRVLGTRNSSSRGRTAVVDAFRVTG